MVKIGAVELALAALSGWVIVIWRERPEWLERAGVRRPRRLLQTHLDWVMMGLILIAVGVAIPDLPAWIQSLVVFGTIVNPLLFIPEAFDPDASSRLSYRVIAIASFTALGVGLTAVAVEALSQ
jgi:hypothetical protein